MSILYDAVKEDFNKIADKLNSLRTKQSLTFIDLVDVFHEIVIDLVHATVDFKNAGPDHKQAVSEAAGELFDDYIIKIKLVEVPGFAKPYVDKFTRDIFIELVGKTYDEILLALNKPVLKIPQTTQHPSIT